MLAEHAEDEDRCQWAADMIELSGNGDKPIEQEPEKVRGKPIEMIPPKRKMPEYLEKQLGG